MNARIKRKVHKIMDLCFDAKDFGHDCMVSYQGHVTDFSIRVYKDGYEKSGKKVTFNHSLYLDDQSLLPLDEAEATLDEIIGYLEKLIEEGI